MVKIYMKKLINNFSRVLCALMFCTGFMFVGCVDGPLGSEENAEQGGDNGGSEDYAALVSVSLGDVTATTVHFDITLDKKVMFQYEEAGLIFSTVDDLDITAETATIFQINRENCSKVFTGLQYNTKYYYTTYLKKGTFYLYGEKSVFTTSNVLLSLSADSITETTAQITGTVEGLAESDKSQIEVGMLYSSDRGKVEKGQGTKLVASEVPSDNTVSFALSELTFDTTYYYCSYVRMNDVTVNGELKSFKTKTEEQIDPPADDVAVVTIAEFLASGGSAIEGIVISNRSLDNLTSMKTMYIQDETAGLQFYLASTHSFSFGDMVRVDVSGVSVGKYNGAVQVSGLDLSKITKISSGNTVTPKTVTIADFLANKYESQYIAIDGVQVADADLGKTFVMGGAHTSIRMEDANNNKFVVFSSKYASYGSQTVPSGSGTIKGISNINNGNMQIIFAQNSDFANLTGNRFSVVDLSSSASANCYIVSKSGLYKFKMTKGNSRESVGTVASVDVLWETFGTVDNIYVGDLVKSVSYRNGDIIFQTADTFKEGNALIAARNASGKILWSWHIWFTNPPLGQEYYSGAGTMMDRNLGAVEGEGCLGLLYQWGRKDPFLGGSLWGSVEAKSTITWPSPVASDENTGTMAYATANPTTFITDDHDWYCYSKDNTPWIASDESKSIYDPCPVGWRVPSGGEYGVWATAFRGNYEYGEWVTGGSANFSNRLGSDPYILYPAAGFRSRFDGSINRDEECGCYWSATPYYDYHLGAPRQGYANAYALYFKWSDNYYRFNANSLGIQSRAQGNSVRCIKEQ